MTDKDSVKDVKEKEALILEAGAKIFSERNFYEVKMQEIADEAGVGKGTIYEYFSGKEDLIGQIFKLSIYKYKEEINYEKIEGYDFWEKLENYLIAHVDFFWENKEIGKLIINSNHPFQEKLKEWLVELRLDSIKELEYIFIEAIENHEIKKVSPILAAKIFRGIMLEIIPPSIIIEGKKPEINEIKEAVRVLKEGLEL